MTIGPEPITRIRWTSVRLGTRHQLAELPEPVARVVRPGGGFGVVLDRERRHVQAAQALERPVVQVPVRQGHPAERRRNDRRLTLSPGGACPPPLRIDGEPVVVGGHLDPASDQVADGLIRPAVAELHLVGPPIERQPEQLMPQTDPNTGTLPSKPMAASTPYVVAAGSPGPLDRNTPSNPSARIRVGGAP